ncbi:hypothetical protein [Treponema endosymbiont of Eucomonympha sp.]|uniref:hypothetical protein n=1 Tax=Treponema endosymbiont of Eucomonympha sp. TaxID=1580831 RepID=UPI000B087644|nr:hypothetical protein [Treponema endosymbiont of Eucomonympha sp.]
MHLITRLQYVNDKSPNNINKLYDKFCKDIAYANKYFSGCEKKIMLWSPIVKNQGKRARHNQLNDVLMVKNKIEDEYQITLITKINKEFMECLTELREYARTETKDNKSPVIRFIQVEEFLKKHLGRGH